MPMYTREEAAEILGVCVNTLDRMRKERKIGYYQARPRCAVKFSQEHIDKYLKRVEQNPKELFRNSRMEMSRNVQSGNTQNLKSSAALVRLPAAPAPTPGTSQAAAQAGCACRP